MDEAEVSGWASSLARESHRRAGAFLTPPVEAVQASWAGLGIHPRSLRRDRHFSSLSPSNSRPAFLNSRSSTGLSSVVVALDRREEETR
jgi:hypothetical protein